MTIVGVAFSFYESRLNEIHDRLADGLARQSNALGVLAIFGLVFAVLVIFAAVRRGPYLALPSVCIPPGIAVFRRYVRRHAGLAELDRLGDFYRQGLKRLQGQWSGTGHGGDEFAPARHPYAHELNLFGPGSMFELLCTTRTELGARRLAEDLLKANSPEAAVRRQEAVRELREATGLRESIALLGSNRLQQVRWETFSDWLKEPAVTFHQGLRCLAPLLAASTVAVPLLALGGAISSGAAAWLFGLLLLAEAVLALSLRGRVRKIISAVQIVGTELAVVREGLALLRDQEFQSEKLRGVQARLNDGAATRLHHLESLVRILDEREKDWFYVPGLLLMAGTQTAMAIESWKAANAADLRSWLDAWAEFEALSALACYAYERQETTTFPEFGNAEAALDAKGIGHPLIARESCVRNDVSLGPMTRFYVVSGSNMAGKSTFLKALGVNTVLALAGAPVTADSLRLSPFSVCASIAPSDSLEQGRSRFLAEIERLRDAVIAAEGPRPVLFLVDELLGGTNSGDRRIASEAIVRALVDRGALGVLSTHDLALAELPASVGSTGKNFHMSSRVGGNLLEFDYRLKPGVCSETNGLAIAAMAGVAV